MKGRVEGMLWLTVLGAQVLGDESSKTNSSRTFFVPAGLGSQRSHFSHR